MMMLLVIRVFGCVFLCVVLGVWFGVGGFVVSGFAFEVGLVLFGLVFGGGGFFQLIICLIVIT